MNLCADDHDEVCFDGRKCPACELKMQINNLEDAIEELNKTIEEQSNE